MRKKTTKILILLIAILIHTPNMTYAKTKKKQIYIPEHEFRIGIGAYPFNQSSFHYPLDGCGGMFPPQFSDDNYGYLQSYNKPKMSTGAITASYGYNILKWLSISAAFTYSGTLSKKYDIITNKTILKENKNNFMITPIIRFNYLNRPMVRLYSQIGVGIGIKNHKISTPNSNNDHKYSTNKWIASGQLTFLGVSVGRKIFGFTEILGFGTQGALVLGIGYKFNNKQ